MNNILKQLLEKYKKGILSEEETIQIIEKNYIFESFKDICWDSNRAYRQNRPEVIFAYGKTDLQLETIVAGLLDKKLPVLITKANKLQARNLLTKFPTLVYSEKSGIVYTKYADKKDVKNQIAIITAGTADIPVAEEAALTAEFFGYSVLRLYDRGIAGLQRILSVQKEITSCSLCIVVAGMEGALPTIVAGLFPGPVIAVPTSIGYGASFNGLSALLGMLNSCADKVAVVNIDNGYGAACVADSIMKIKERQ